MIVVPQNSWRQRLFNPSATVKTVVFLTSVIAFSTAGFMYFETREKPEIEWLDAFWWSIVTMTTVGFGDYFPASAGGRFLVGIPTMLVGMGMLGYVLSQIAAFFIRAETLNRKGLTVQRLSGHIIVCNFPQPSGLRRLLDEIRSQPETRAVPLVLIDEHLAELDDDLAGSGIRFVRGHPARQLTLDKAGLSRASRAIILARTPTSPSSDDTTLATCLLIKDLRPDIHVVAECVNPDNRELLMRAGCQSIVCVMDLAPGILAQELHDPGVAQVLQELTVWHEDLNNVYIVPVALAQPNRTVAQLQQWAASNNATIIGVRHNRTVAVNPPPDRAIRDRDAAIVICRTRPDIIEL